MKTLTGDQRQIMIDRLQTNLYTHGMRSQLFREMRNKFIREQRAEAQACVFNKMLEDKNIDAVEVQNRVAIAQAQLPAEVIRNGVSVRSPTARRLIFAADET